MTTDNQEPITPTPEQQRRHKWHRPPHRAWSKRAPTYAAKLKEAGVWSDRQFDAVMRFEKVLISYRREIQVPVGYRSCLDQTQSGFDSDDVGNPEIITRYKQIAAKLGKKREKIIVEVIDGRARGDIDMLRAAADILICEV